MNFKKVLGQLLLIVIFLSVGYLFGHTEAKPTPPTVALISSIPSPSPEPISTVEPDVLLALTSQYRIEHSLTGLKKSDTLCAFAVTRANQIVDNSDFSHAGFLPLTLIGPYKMIRPLGENLARDFYTNQTILDAWIASPTHKANLDSPLYNQACVITKDNVVVMIYGS